MANQATIDRFNDWKDAVVCELLWAEKEFPESAEYLFDLGYSVNSAVAEILDDGSRYFV